MGWGSYGGWITSPTGDQEDPPQAETINPLPRQERKQREKFAFYFPSRIISFPMRFSFSLSSTTW
jgi:hypothetical protein